MFQSKQNDAALHCDSIGQPGATKRIVGGSDGLRDHWRIPWLCAVPVRRPCSFCYSCFCPCYMAYTQRREILDLADEPYVCCGGRFKDYQCCCLRVSDFMTSLKEEQPSYCPSLCLEVTLCPSLAVISNRQLIQTLFDRPDTVWDDCPLCNTICCQLVQQADELEAIKQDIDAGVHFPCMIFTPIRKVNDKREGYYGTTPEVTVVEPARRGLTPFQQAMYDDI